MKSLAPQSLLARLRNWHGQPAVPRAFPHPLDKRLWAGFGTVTAHELEAVQTRWSTRPAEMAGAAWSLARWSIGNGDYENALRQLYLFRSALPRTAPRTSSQALEIDCLTALGRFADAEQAVVQGLASAEDSPERIREICFSAANLLHARSEREGEARDTSDKARIGWFNRVLKEGGFAGIKLANQKKPLTIDNLTTTPLAADPDSAAAKVSVLMAAHNCVETIDFAVKSILAQTWSNLELVVVDDASTDDTWKALERLATADERVRPIRHERNRGAYAARNTALAAATGDYVTVQDSDDWGHPEKIAAQMRGILKEGHRLNATSYLRIGPNLEVVRNQSSGASMGYHRATLLYAMRDVAELGCWDDAWMGADSEFEERFTARFGVGPALVAEATPLTFYLSRTTSLTNLAGIGMGSLKYGARAEYRECRTYWHGLELAKETPDLKLPRKGRPFPAPRICLQGRSEVPQKYDVLFVSDFTLSETALESDLSARLAGHRLGLSQACLFWPRLDNIGKNHNVLGRAQIHDGVVATVVAEENIECDLVVTDPMVLQNLPDKPPSVRAKSCVIVCAEAPSKSEIKRAIDNARIVFGAEPVVAPMFAPVRRALEKSGQGEWLTATDWSPFVDLAAEPRERASEPQRVPVAGREASLEAADWPSRPEALQAAYGKRARINMRILGQTAEHVRDALVRSRIEWIPRTESDLATFLAGLDFYIYHPHESLEAPLSRAPFEAMAAGIPVIAPARLADVFGEAAVYAEPAGVAEAILKLWRDPARYAAQAKRGRDWVSRFASPAVFGDRIAAFISPPVSQRRRAVVG